MRCYSFTSLDSGMTATVRPGSRSQGRRMSKTVSVKGLPALLAVRTGPLAGAFIISGFQTPLPSRLQRPFLEAEGHGVPFWPHLRCGWVMGPALCRDLQAPASRPELHGRKRFDEPCAPGTGCHFHLAGISSPASASRIDFPNCKGGHPTQTAIPGPLSTVIGPEVGRETEAGQSELCLKLSAK